MATVKKTELNKDKLARKISEGYGSIKSLMSGYGDYVKSRQAAASKRMEEERAKAGIKTFPSAAAMARQATAAPARSRANTIAPLKPMSFISQPSAPKSAPAARPAAPTARPVAKATPRPAASASAPAAKPMARPSASVARIDTPMVRSVATQEVAPMAKREVKIDTTTKRRNLLQRLGERVKQRQLARASKSVGTPMKSTTSIPSTPTPSAPQTESGQKLSAVGKAMLDKYMSKKYMGGGKMEYMGGGKMKKYAKGGMIEKNKVKPTSDSTYYYAEKEYISKLKGLTANSKPEMDKQFALQDKAKHDRWRQGNKGKPGYDKNGFLIKNETTKTKKYAKGGIIEKEGMKPKGKMDKKKAFLEMIAKLKAKKK